MKRKMNLQNFAEAVRGKRIVYLYRLKSEAEKLDAELIPFVTENGRSVSTDADSTATKDGPIRTPGTPEIEISTTSYLAKDDAMLQKLEDAQLKGETIEIWEANLDEPEAPGQNKFKAIYYWAKITSFEKNSSAEDYVEISMTLGIEGTGKRGIATVTAEQQEIAEYTFADTQKTGE